MSEAPPEAGDGDSQNSPIAGTAPDSNTASNENAGTIVSANDQATASGGGGPDGESATSDGHGNDGADDDDDDDEEDDDDDEEEEDDDDDGDDDEPKLKYARLTQHLSTVYRNGDATSSFIVAGDKMVRFLQQILSHLD